VFLSQVPYRTSISSSRVLAATLPSAREYFPRENISKVSYFRRS
jgi:hypothetical protein